MSACTSKRVGWLVKLRVIKLSLENAKPLFILGTTGFGGPERRFNEFLQRSAPVSVTTLSCPQVLKSSHLSQSPLLPVASKCRAANLQTDLSSSSVCTLHRLPSWPTNVLNSSGRCANATSRDCASSVNLSNILKWPLIFNAIRSNH